MKKFIILFVVIAILISGFLFLGRAAYPLKYQSEIKKYSAEYNVDPALVAAIIRNQSGFKALGYKKGEKSGVMEIRDFAAKKWAKEMGMENFEGKMLADPSINIQLGTWYLGKLTKQNDNIDTIIEGWCNRHASGGIKLDKDEIDRYMENCKDARNIYNILYGISLK
ncbi:transglycosylase SLT domain-containing protein [Crassaminicella profunda]|uniref:transglycosylase SLT domain-containing protein n=1 Tax=Crassaminicella profunda TaxID=1286698 RepID=UPI001CA635E7|nr:transglycosylase SLT domain-containing protein [Crassaminicella profunda]QZY55205.1 transglycosylase SLT domain-containing protein [Crassaminicella profunda]